MLTSHTAAVCSAQVRQQVERESRRGLAAILPDLSSDVLLQTVRLAILSALLPTYSTLLKAEIQPCSTGKTEKKSNLYHLKVISDV